MGRINWRNNLNWFIPQYKYRKTWKHTVELKQVEFKSSDFGTTVDPDELEEVIVWANQNAQARRISYDTWQFGSSEDANQFIMLYKLRWGV